MKRMILLLPLYLLIVCVTLSGCGTLKPYTQPDTSGQGSLTRRILAGLFTNATMSDLQFDGIVNSQADMVADLAGDLVASRSPQLSAAIQFAVSSGLVEPQGPRLLQFTGKGEALPKTLICRTKMVAECAALLPNQGVRVYVQQVGLGQVTVYIVHRIVVL